MLANRKVFATIPAGNLDRARKWYADKLGLTPSAADQAGVRYDMGEGTGFLLYPTQNAGQAPNTLMTFQCDNVREDVAALRSKGVVFEDYDLPGLKTENGVARLGNREAAWFRDSEDNILALGSGG